MSVCKYIEKRGRRERIGASSQCGWEATGHDSEVSD